MQNFKALRIFLLDCYILFLIRSLFVIITFIVYSETSEIIILKQTLQKYKKYGM